MGTKSKSSKRTLLLRDFVVDEDENYVYREGDYEIIFYDGFVRIPKRYIQVWYIENTTKYLKDETLMDWDVLQYRYQKDERNKLFWNKVNKFYEEYIYECNNC